MNLYFFPSSFWSQKIMIQWFVSIHTSFFLFILTFSLSRFFLFVRLFGWSLSKSQHNSSSTWNRTAVHTQARANDSGGASNWYWFVYLIACDGFIELLEWKKSRRMYCCDSLHSLSLAVWWLYCVACLLATVNATTAAVCCSVACVCVYVCSVSLLLTLLLLFVCMEFRWNQISFIRLS